MTMTTNEAQNHEHGHDHGHDHGHKETAPAVPQNDTGELHLTEVAAAKVREISKEEGLDGQGLRVQVKGGGCSGFQYDLFFDEKPTDMDLVIESHGIQLFVDPLSVQYLEGTEIDYVEGLHGAGFKFINPQVKGTCGCGSSFSV